MLDSGIFSRKVGADSGLDTRITALEETYYEFTFWREISSGTSGTITKPVGSEILLDRWPNDIDAVVSVVVTGEVPDEEYAYTSAGAVVTTTLDTSGNFTLSGTPSSFPVAIIARGRVPLSGLNAILASEELLDFEKIDTGVTITVSESFPVSSKEGDFLLHSPVGRQILYQRVDSTWESIQSFGAMTVFVDPTGTDDLDHGTGTGTDAFASIPFAFSVIPGMYGGDVTINAPAEVFADDGMFAGKHATGAYTIEIAGTFTEQRSLTTVSSATAGSRTAHATLTINGASLTTDQYQGMVLKFADATDTVALQGLTYTVMENDNAANSVVTIVGAWVDGFGTTPSASDTFTIEKAGTEMSGNIDQERQAGIKISKCIISGAYRPNEQSSLTVEHCDFPVRFISGDTFLNIDTCNFKTPTNSRCATFSGGNTTAGSSLFNGVNLTSEMTIDIAGGKFNTSNTNAIINNTGSKGGLYIRSRGLAVMVSATTKTKNTIKDNNNGLRVDAGHAEFSTATNILFSGNSTDSSADAATFSSIS